MRQGVRFAVLIALMIATFCFGVIVFTPGTTQAALWPGTVAGTVTNGETGKPIPGVLVELLDEQGKRVAGPVVSDEHGEYSVKAPQPGSYTVSARHDGYESLALPVEIGLDPLGEVMINLNEYHVIDIPPEHPGTGEEEATPVLSTLLSTLLPALAIGLLLVIGAVKSRDLRNHN